MTGETETYPAPRSGALGIQVRRALGGLLPLIDDPSTRDVLLHVVDGAARLAVDRGEGAEPVAGWQTSVSDLRALAVTLIAAGGRHLDELQPCADVRLGDGIRVHAVLGPIAVAGPVVSIRLPRTTPVTLTELADSGLCTPDVTALLERSVEVRRNILITGGAGSGKTTLLSALLGLVPSTERIVTIEDVAELRPAHPHHVALETRQANIEGAGELGLDRLLRETLRMRPDRIVLGECRGAEIATLLAALNTGHQGGAGTLHANRLRDVPARLEALGMLAGLTPAALARQALALDLIVHVTRQRSRHRIAELGVFAVGSDGTLDVRVHATGDPAGRRTEGANLGSAGDAAGAAA